MRQHRIADPQQERAAAFERERGRLLGVAYRMLGRWAEAEDAVQDAWLRFADAEDVRDPAAWLTTVVARICLDVLRSARVRREAYVGPWLPEPLVARMSPTGEADGLAAGDPAEAVARTDEIGYALLVVLERLTPEQRAAFVLHDIFAVPFDRIATVLGTSAEAARQLATRARRAVASGQSRRRASRGEQRRAVSAFLAAAHSGDLDGLLAVLAPEVTMTGDGGGVFPAGRPLEGAVPIARFVGGLFRRLQNELGFEMEPVLVNGDVGVVIEVRPRPDRDLSFMEGVDLVRIVMVFDVGEDGRIVSIFDQLNPDKLTRLPAVADLR